MTLFLGLDLNGLWDFAAEGDEDPSVVLKDLGIHGSLVRLMGMGRSRWVGGPQTAHAPHGKGAGWGRIGASANRLFLKDILNQLTESDLKKEHAAAFQSFLGDLAGDARGAVFAVPDVTSFDEAARERLLRLLARSSRLRSILLWRPMAAVLGWLEGSAFPQGIPPSDGLRIAVLSLMGSGMQLADAKLIQESWNGDDIWVPERDKAGIEIGGVCAGDTLARQTTQSLVARLGSEAEAVLESINTPWRACVGAEPDFELLRMPNRSWRRVPKCSPSDTDMAIADLPEIFKSRLASADVLLVEGPMAQNGTWVEAVLRAANLPADFPVHRAANGLVAKGCFIAALRAQVGSPVYYDFLPQLEINALVADEPRFVELIPKSTRLMGGTPYKGDAPGEFAIVKGATRLTFYLFKEDFPKGRKAEVDLPEKAQSQHRIRVSVEQSPGQGFAKVRIDSATFDVLSRQPLELDWAGMEVVDETQEQILEALTGESGLTYPDTITTFGHPLHWHPNHRAGDLVDQLQTYIDSPLLQRDTVDEGGQNALKILRKRFLRPENPSFVARRMGLGCDDRGSFRALDSDGSLPAMRGGISVPAEADHLLDAALAKAGEELDQVLAREGSDMYTTVVADLIGFASWCFWRCPSSIADFLLAVYDGSWNFSLNHILLREGVGRAVHSREQLERYFAAVDAKLAGNANLTASEFSAISRVLGSVDEAADRLPPRTADRILQETCSQIAEENHQPRTTAFKRRFKFELLMLAALLRHRRTRPNFLDPTDSFAARELLAVLGESMERNQRFREEEERAAMRTHAGTRHRHLAAAKRLDLNADILSELIDLIHMKGSDPNIIRKIEEMEE